eukprot:TRINITY_DN21677_c0_g1_i1.p1 TRINITY_DN21677_c0_g1~~TRINITY_DN21677_c0_g1_i1.p1  ORF type:complete len:142 (-),score=9.44 TRINITY_DN21677_c0_g1_i1:283-708(-)
MVYKQKTLNKKKTRPRCQRHGSFEGRNRILVQPAIEKHKNRCVQFLFKFIIIFSFLPKEEAKYPETQTAGFSFFKKKKQSKAQRLIVAATEYRKLVLGEREWMRVLSFLSFFLPSFSSSFDPFLLFWIGWPLPPSGQSVES